MKYFIQLIFAGVIALAQGASFGLQCPANGLAGTTIQCQLVLSGGNTITTGPVDLQATLNTSWTPGGASNLSITGVGATAAKSIGFNSTTQIFIVYGINGNQLPDGIIANVSFPIPSGINGNQTISLTNIIGVTASSANFPIAASPVTTVFISISNCDVDKNGTVNNSDVAAELQGILSKGSADRNGDGVTNVIDLRIIENAVLGLGCIASQ